MPAASHDIDPAFPLHVGGKIEVRPTVRIRDAEGLALAYTPGVGRVSAAIAANPELADEYTWRSNVVAVVTDGTAVLGLGDIGPSAALPVMEGKALLFKEFGGIDAVPICLDTKDVDEIVETVVRLAPSFGGINLEDISAPRCFEIEQRLQERLDLPVFHDDQHGTAIVVLAALRNAATVTGRQLCRPAGRGLGGGGRGSRRLADHAPRRGSATSPWRTARGSSTSGAVTSTASSSCSPGDTNTSGYTGSIEEALKGADVFIGVSAGQIAEEAVASMAPDSIVFALANPEPEVHPEVARRHARVVATGRSDFPNQINNVLAFPGIFRGALAVRATRITEGMKLAAAEALADTVGDQLSEEWIVPSPFDPFVAETVAKAVSAAARAEGVARR